MEKLVLGEVVSLEFVVGLVGSQILEGDVQRHSEVLESFIELWDFGGVDDQDVALAAHLQVFFDAGAGVLADERVHLFGDRVLDYSWHSGDQYFLELRDDEVVEALPLDPYAQRLGVDVDVVDLEVEAQSLGALAAGETEERVDFESLDYHFQRALLFAGGTDLDLEVSVEGEIQVLGVGGEGVGGLDGEDVAFPVDVHVLLDFGQVELYVEGGGLLLPVDVGHLVFVYLLGDGFAVFDADLFVEEVGSGREHQLRLVGGLREKEEKGQ